MRTKNNRIGKVDILKILIDDNPKHVSKIFTILEAVVLRTKYYYETDTIQYVLLSQKFKVVPEGSLIPRYRLTIKTVDGNIDNVIVEECD